MRNAICDLCGQAIGEGFAIGVVGGADLGRDRKARGHRQANRRHPVQIRPLAAEQFLVASTFIINAAAEAVHILGH